MLSKGLTALISLFLAFPPSRLCAEEEQKKPEKEKIIAPTIHRENTYHILFKSNLDPNKILYKY